jgi:hypothetical protein
LKTCSAAVRAVGHKASWRGRFTRGCYHRPTRP